MWVVKRHFEAVEELGLEARAVEAALLQLVPEICNFEGLGIHWCALVLRVLFQVFMINARSRIACGEQTYLYIYLQSDRTTSYVLICTPGTSTFNFMYRRDPYLQICRYL